MIKRKIHKSWISFGSATLCGIYAYSREHIRWDNIWKGVNCKRCLNLREIRKRDKR